jgi:hypothetical protein
MRNPSSLAAFFVAVLALGVLAGAGYAAWEYADVSWLQAALAVPLAGLLAVFALALGSRGRSVHQRTLGRAGGAGVARAARGLGLLTLVLVATAALALAVFAVLVTTEGLTTAPW